MKPEVAHIVNSTVFAFRLKETEKANAADACPVVHRLKSERSSAKRMTLRRYVQLIRVSLLLACRKIGGIPSCGKTDFSYWALWALLPGLACCRHPS